MRRSAELSTVPQEQQERQPGSARRPQTRTQRRKQQNQAMQGTVDRLAQQTQRLSSLNAAKQEQIEALQAQLQQAAAAGEGKVGALQACPSPGLRVEVVRLATAALALHWGRPGRSPWTASSVPDLHAAGCMVTCWLPVQQGSGHVTPQQSGEQG